MKLESPALPSVYIPLKEVAVDPDYGKHIYTLKGLGHAILGNFSTDQMVIELTKI